MRKYDVVIVGAGPSGLTAAIYAARANMKVLLLDKLAPGGQIINTNEIQNYPGVGNIPGADLAYQMFEHVQSFDHVTFDYKTVVEIKEDTEGKLVVCKEDDEVIGANAVIVATGTSPRRLNIPGEAPFLGHGISWCAICDGAQFANREVVVIGGGNSAVEEATFLAPSVTHLSLITLYDLTADRIACERLRSFSNVTIWTFQDVLKFTGDDKLCGVKIKSTITGEEKTVECDGVFEYIGLIPITDFLEKNKILNSAHYVSVDDKMHTKMKGVFAAGDCIEKNLRQVITACADGAIAAQEASHYVKEIQNGSEKK
ncbi:MAG: FAD-dependent oxidoreductase [Hungatella sp.]